MSLIYLDNNATTKVDPQVLEAMLPYFKEEYANPSSVYEFAKRSNHAVREARGVIKDFYNARDEKEIIFTSCGSESANTAIRGVLNMNKNKRHIITTKVEHPCVLNLYRALEKEGYRVDYIGVNSNGELDLEQLKEAIDEDTALVSVMYANNETGVVFPIKKISEIIKSKNPETKFYVDAVQVTGKLAIDVQDLGVDLMGISGHKFHAPKGIGALYVNSKTLITPLIIGGHQERGKRAGTENVAGIVGFGAACEISSKSLHEDCIWVSTLKQRFYMALTDALKKSGRTEIGRTNGPSVLNPGKTLNLCLSGIDGQTLLLMLDGKNICISAGSACRSHEAEPSHVLTAMGLTADEARSSIRISFSRMNTADEAVDAANIIASCIEILANEVAK